MISELMARLRSLWAGMRRRSAFEAEMQDEFRQHIELRARDLMRNGLSSKEALLQARREFGSTARYAEDARAARGVNRLDALRFSWLDLKLGARMMARYPGLTLIGGVAMALGVAIAAGYTAAMQSMLQTALPLPGGDRVVSLQNWDLRDNDSDDRVLHDFITWRLELKSVREVGAYRTISRNVIAANAAAEPMPIAEMSAAGFRVAGVRPLLGRYFLADDERPDAVPVAVIGYDFWQRRFAGATDIVGRELRIGATVHTVVGVMPEGFAFPINHNFWVPFRIDRAGSKHGEGPFIKVFGRIAPGSTMSEARAELDVIGRRTAAAFPDTHKHLRARILWYTWDAAGLDHPDALLFARTIPFIAALVLGLVSVNVGMLVYARTTLRRAEIVVRTALGASRRRVVAQLFAESFVLALVAAALGLLIATIALDLAERQLAGGDSPFWLNLRLSFSTVIYGVALAVFAAAITGVLPALKVTGRQLRDSLQQLTGGGKGIMLGRTWTLLVIGQVAAAVSVLPLALFVAQQVLRYGMNNPGFPADEYVSSLVYMDGDLEEERPPAALAETHKAEFSERYAQRIPELMRRLRAEPGVDQVTFAWTVPGNEGPMLIDVEGVKRPAEHDAAAHSGPWGHTVREARVDVGFFTAFRQPILAGRNFIATDASDGSTAVIVNQSFARRFFGEGNAIGQRVRSAGQPDENQPWYEIVGVVPDFPSGVVDPEDHIPAAMYFPSAPERIYPVRMAVHAPAAHTARVAARMGDIAASVDPALQQRSVRTIATVYERERAAIRLVGIAITIVVISVLLLSAAGIYAMMSVAVIRRRREIGIRSALGASPGRLLASIFARSTLLLGAGTGAGLVVAIFLDNMLAGATRSPILVPIVLAIMLTVGVVASIGPARKGLRIQPTEALKQE